MKKLFLFSIMVIAAILLGWAYVTFTNVDSDKAQDVSSVMAPFIDVDEVQPVGEIIEDQLERYQYRAILKDVAKSGGSGQALAGYVSEYRMIATFDSLPEPSGTDFYEGWVVRKSPLSVISTGRAEKNKNDMYVNTFSSNKNLIDHDFYVLTLEPDDGDPAPAVHILEGTFEAI